MLIPLAVAVISSTVRFITGYDLQFRVLQPDSVSDLGLFLVLIIPLQFVLSLIGSPLAEEPGWRGFLLPKFYNKVWASLVVSVCSSYKVVMAYTFVYSSWCTSLYYFLLREGQ